MNSEKQYIELFKEHRALIESGSQSLVNAHRQEALQQLLRKGLPSQKDERYRYIDLQAALAPDFGLNLQRRKIEIDPFLAYRCSIPNLGSRLFYVVNDEIRAKDQLVDEEDLFIGSLCTFATKRPEIFKKHYNKLRCDGLAALNTLLSQDGVVVYLAEGKKVDSVIQIVNLTVGARPMMTNRRLMVILERNAQATLLLCDHSATKQEHLTTEVAEINLGQDSRLNLYCIEETAPKNTLLNTTNICQKEGSRLVYGSLTLQSGLTRRTLDVHLQGTGAQAELSGLSIEGEKQHVDQDLLISHDSPNCKSDVLYKYVLDGESIGAFAGKVYVEKGAIKTDSEETNENLCVSETAHIYTRPMLEIYADDVKCNHGSTVGQLNETALFYMAQRGIPPKEGRLLLQQAFAFKVLDRIGLEPLKMRLYKMIEERFRRGAGICGDCSLCAAK